MTLAETRTESPTLTCGVEEPVKTRTPSLVAGSLSGFVSWIQKPREVPATRTAVTTPGTLVTLLPAYGESRVAPWMSWMRTSPGVMSVGEGAGDGSPPPSPPVPALLRGLGVEPEKSAELLSVSVKAASRLTECVLSAPVAGEVSRTTAVPKPTRSLMLLSAAQSAAVRQASGVVEWTSATVPLLADMPMVPAASGVGSAVSPPAPLASSTR